MVSLLFALALAQAQATPPVPPPDKVLATLDGAPIKAADVEPYLWDWRGYEALEDILSYKLLANAAAKAGVSLTEAETDAAVSKQLDELKKSAPAGRSFEDSLRQQGFPKSRIVMRVKTELLLDKIVLKDFHPSDYIKISTIVFRPESEQMPALAATIRRADAAYDKLKKGTSWDIVLGENETAPQALKGRGSVGWRALAAFPTSVAAEMRNLTLGGITKPAQTTYGIQIFKIDGLGASAKGKDLDDLKNVFLASARPAELNKIRAEAKIERLWP